MGTEGLPHKTYSFDRFTLDLGRGTLLASGGAEVPLRPKSFALLRLLVENAGRLLDRDAITAALWPGVFATDESIAQCVKDVRRALGDEAQRLVRTVPKRGYRLEAEFSEGEPPPRSPSLPPEARQAGQQPGAGQLVAAVPAASIAGDAGHLNEHGQVGLAEQTR